MTLTEFLGADFRARKAARIASGQKKYKFQVVAGFPFDGQIVGTFNSKKAAKEFAFDQVNCFVSDTKAMRALSASNKSHIPSSIYFSIERKEC